MKRAKFDTHGADTTLNERSGQIVEILRPLTDQEHDREDVGNMYKIQFSDGLITDAFEDELEKIEDRTEEFLSAADVVCLSCAYMSDASCSKCPVRLMVDRLENPNKYQSFINDREKIDDLLHLSQDEFLESYSYLTEEEYALTIIDIMARLFPDE